MEEVEGWPGSLHLVQEKNALKKALEITITWRDRPEEVDKAVLVVVGWRRTVGTVCAASKIALRKNANLRS